MVYVLFKLAQCMFLYVFVTFAEGRGDILRGLVSFGHYFE